MPYLKESSIHFAVEPRLNKRPKSDLLVLYAFKEGDTLNVPVYPKDWSQSVQALIQSKDFKGKEGEVALMYGSGDYESRLAVVGLGEQKKVTSETVSNAYAKLGQEVQKRKIGSITVVPPKDGAIPATFGLLHGNYVFTLHKGSKEEDSLLRTITYIGISSDTLPEIEEAKTLVEGIDVSRDLINTNADEMTPSHLGAVAKEIAATSKNFKVEVYGKKWLEKNRMGLILAVNRGSSTVEPSFTVLEYTGAPQSKEKTVLVGKGITYDTGGLNLKVGVGIETMKADMSGAAIVLSTLYVAAKLKLPINVTAVVPATENAIGPQSFKPGDVYHSYSGKTVEIGNTDAEGRLILADAISWAEKNLHPTRIIDVATLTGSIVIALGTGCAGLFTPDETLADQLLEASRETNERLWRMPLIEDYKESLKSYVADTNNIGSREGGSITAALFIEQFVEKTPWAHLDIAGVAFTKHPQGVYPKNATGYGVRLMTHFLKQPG